MRRVSVFWRTVKKMLRDRVKVEFDAELSDGVAAEWANADGEDLKSNIENLKKVTETRREEIRKLKFKRSATPEQVKRGLVDERSEDTILGEHQGARGTRREAARGYCNTWHYSRRGRHGSKGRGSRT
jgi:hypothetical protein